MTATAQHLSSTAAGELVELLDGGAVRCLACAHRCRLDDGQAGICKVRYNVLGELRVPWGYFTSIDVAPIEKQPFYHFLPGRKVVAFGTLGCDLHCPYCHNAKISQAFRDPNSWTNARTSTVDDVIGLAVREGCAGVVSGYNEPLISSEWAVELFQAAHAAGLRTGYATDGNATPEVLAYLRPWLDMARVDLKTGSPEGYRTLGGVLQPVLDSLAWFFQMGIWLEVVTCIVPGFNDSDAEVLRMARTIAEISRDIPWHLVAFHPDYKMQSQPWTSAETLMNAARIATGSGLRYAYCSNLWGQVGIWQDTYCPGCAERLVGRYEFAVQLNRMNGAACPDCGYVLPGVWS